MSDDILKRAKDALDEVVHGPWTVDPDKHWNGGIAEDGEDEGYWDVDGPNSGWMAHCQDLRTAQFVAAARTLMPELIAEVERLRAEAIVQKALHERDLAAERAHGDRWQKLAGAYDDVRYALRNASDDQAGHAQFYNEAAELIFPEAQP